MLLAWCAAFFWGAPAEATPSRASPPVHRDSAAGVKFEIPFARFDVVSGKAVQAALSTSKGPPPPSDMTFTSGVIAKGGSPYIVVWTRPYAAPLTRPYVDELVKAQGKAADALRAQGFATFRFSAKMLTGIADLAARDGQKTKVAMRLLKDHMAYIAYYYRKDSEAKAFDSVVQSLRSSRRVGVRYEDLPLEPEGSWVAKVLGVVSAVGIGVALLALTIIFYRSMQQSRLLTEAPLPQGILPADEQRPHGLAGLRARPLDPMNQEGQEARPKYGEPSVGV